MGLIHALRNAARVARSVLPAEPEHFLLLLGAILLYISPRLAWWNSSPSPTWEIRRWLPFVTVLGLPLEFAGAAAARVALLRCERPVRKLILLALLPSVASLIAIPSVGLFYFSNEIGLSNYLPNSIFESSEDYWRAIPHLLDNLGFGFRVAVAGFLCVALFAFLYRRGRLTLPIRLSEYSSPVGPIGEASDDREIARFGWAMVFLTALLYFANGAFAAIFIAFGGRFRTDMNFVITLDTISSAVALCLFVWLAVGKNRRDVFRSVLARPRLLYLGLGILIPAAIAGVWPTLSFLQARMEWGQAGIGRFAPPDPLNYFGLPPATSLLFVVGALIEEIAWRGFLQPRMIRKYGLARGVLLVGIVWGAFHFFGDASGPVTLSGFSIRLSRRLIETVSQSYVLAWLTVRARSVLPAALAHAVFNMFVSHELPVHSSLWLLIALWGAAGIVLFRFFPPQLDLGELAHPGPTPLAAEAEGSTTEV